ncbi:MAG TPA: hypothetical protein VNN72_26840 [Polyangiaceae bacterium]|nr:hypothetical protein [Polyangiaceae bacterium]
MDLRVFNDAELAIALGAARAVELRTSPDQDGLLAEIARLHGVELEPKRLPQPSLAYTARVFRDSSSKRRLLELATVLTVDDCELQPIPSPRVSLLARALGESDRDVRVLRERAAYQKLLARVDFTRRMAARMFGDEWPSEPPLGLQQPVSGPLQAAENAALANRYHALGRLHPMSFGYALWNHYRANHFRFPGEGGGVAERLSSHDVGHVLSGYDTTPEGEIQLAAFQSGIERDFGLMALYLGILQFQFFGRVSPTAQAHPQEICAEKLSLALERGAACRAGVGEGWDFWPLVAQHLSDVRRTLGIVPIRCGCAA